MFNVTASMTVRLAELADEIRRCPAVGPWHGPVSLAALFDALAAHMEMANAKAVLNRIVASAGRLTPDDLAQIRSLLPAPAGGPGGGRR